MKNVFVSLMTVCLLLSSCNQKKNEVKEGNENAKTKTENVEAANPDPAHNSQNSIDFEGTYEGTLPTASGEGMKVSLVLTNDTYKRTVSYVGKPGKPTEESGKFTWSKEGSIITLEGASAPNKYLVGENKLIHLDMDGKEITGQLADKYILTKK